MHIVNLTNNWKVWGHYDATASLLIEPWCKEYCIGLYYRVRSTYSWQFEKLEDAVAFKLRWDGVGY